MTGEQQAAVKAGRDFVAGLPKKRDSNQLKAVNPTLIQQQTHKLVAACRMVKAPRKLSARAAAATAAAAAAAATAGLPVAKTSTQKVQRNAYSNGKVGACLCAGKCRTTMCPCRKANQFCGEGCHVHGSSKNPCQNTAQGDKEAATERKRKRDEKAAAAAAAAAKKATSETPKSTEAAPALDSGGAGGQREAGGEGKGVEPAPGAKRKKSAKGRSKQNGGKRPRGDGYDDIH